MFVKWCSISWYNRPTNREGNQGLGVNSLVPGEDDNEYDAYRKRMMLAYRFRPNPLVSITYSNINLN